MDIFFLSTILPWTVVLSFLIICSIPIFYLPTLFRVIRKSSPWTIFLILGIQALALYIRFAWVPNDHRIYFDEDRYLSYGASFARYGKAVSLDVATPTHVIIGVPDEAGRVTVPVLNAILFKLAGYSEHTLFVAAKILHSFSVFGMVILGYLLYKNKAIGILSAVGIALLPTTVFYAPSFGLDLYFMDISILSLIAVCIYAKFPSRLSGLWLFSAIILLTCVRIEAFVILPILILTYYFIRKSRVQNIFIYTHLYLYIGIIIYLIIRSLASLSVVTKPWCCAEALPLEAFSLSYLSRHILPNIRDLFVRPEFPWLISVTAVYALFVSTEWQTRILGIWIAVCFATYSSYYAGLFFNPEFSGSYGRYLLILIPPFLLLSSSTIVEAFKRWKLRIHSKPAYVISALFIIGISLYPTIVRYPKLITYSPWDRLAEGGPRIIHTFLIEDILPKTPPNAVIIHNLTAPIIVSGKTAVFTGSFLEDPKVREFVTNALKSHQPVFMLPNYRCLLYPNECLELKGLYQYKSFLKRNFGDNTTLELQQLFLPN